MGVPPGNRPAVPRDWFRGVPEWYVAGGACPACPERSLGEPACPEPVEGVEGTLEDARQEGHIHGRSRQFMEYPG